MIDYGIIPSVLQVAFESKRILFTLDAGRASTRWAFVPRPSGSEDLADLTSSCK